MSDSLRWIADISYLTDRPMDTVAFEEIEDLGTIIEHGPDRNEIDRIVITLHRSFPLEQKDLRNV